MGKVVSGASVTPPPGDQANEVLSGTFSATGVSGPFPAFGWFNVSLWGSIATALTTTSGSASATVGSGTGLVQGMGVNGVNVPAGTTIATVSGTSVTLAFPPGFTAADVVGGVDNTATYATTAVSGSVQLEKTFDGGATWLIASYQPTGDAALFTNPQSVSLTFNEVERGVAYRMNCVGYTSGTLHYRLSATGLGNTTFGPRG